MLGLTSTKKTAFDALYAAADTTKHVAFSVQTSLRNQFGLVHDALLSRALTAQHAINRAKEWPLRLSENVMNGLMSRKAALFDTVYAAADKTKAFTSSLQSSCMAGARSVGHVLASGASTLKDSVVIAKNKVEDWRFPVSEMVKSGLARTKKAWMVSLGEAHKVFCSG